MFGSIDICGVGFDSCFVGFWSSVGFGVVNFDFVLNVVFWFVYFGFV